MAHNKQWWHTSRKHWQGFKRMQSLVWGLFPNSDESLFWRGLFFVFARLVLHYVHNISKVWMHQVGGSKVHLLYSLKHCLSKLRLLILSVQSKPCIANWVFSDRNSTLYQVHCFVKLHTAWLSQVWGGQMLCMLTTFLCSLGNSSRQFLNRNSNWNWDWNTYGFSKSRDQDRCQGCSNYH